MILILIICALVFAFGIYMIIINDKAKAEHRRQQEQSRNPIVVKKESNSKSSPPRVKVDSSSFTFEEAKKVMIGSDRTSCKAVYSIDNFYTAAFDCILNDIPKVDLDVDDPKEMRQDLSSFPVEKCKQLTKSTVLSSYRSFVAIDVETTGLSPEKNSVIELSAIKFVDFSPVEHFYTYINPGKHIPDRTTEINGITDEMVKNAPAFSQISNQLQEFIKGFHIIAYNAMFDMKFLHCSGIDLLNHKSKIYDVLEIARKHIKENDDDCFEYPSNFKLSTVCQTRHIGSNTFHSANADALACALLFIDIIKKINNVENAYSLIDETERQNGIKPFYLKSYKGERV